MFELSTLSLFIIPCLTLLLIRIKKKQISNSINKFTTMSLLPFSFYSKFWRSTQKQIIQGKFIVIEGLDRSGKSSVSRYLKTKLTPQAETIAYGFPDRTTRIGQLINDHLQNKVEISNETIHLLFSANRWEAMKILNEKLESDINIVCDRYWYSGVAYSVAKGLNFEWCMDCDKGLRKPDLILFLKGDPKKLAERNGFGGQRFERLDFQTKVNEGFKKIMKKEENVRTIHVDGLSLEEVEEEAYRAVKQHFGHI